MTAKMRFTLRRLDDDVSEPKVLNLVRNGVGNGSPASVIVGRESIDSKLNGKNRRTNPMATSAEIKSTTKETEETEAGRLEKIQNWAQASVRSATRRTTLRATDAARR